MALPTGLSLIASATRTSRVLYPLARAHTAMGFTVTATFAARSPRQDAYNILWAVVFGFATLNILSLAARRFEPTRRGLSFGELLAVMVVFISVFLLGWEMLNLFHVFPIKLHS